jgi:hypothetical protein
MTFRELTALYRTNSEEILRVKRRAKPNPVNGPLRPGIL